ncbi:hypothetical protein J0S82_015403, partial [Galemys pyrenaicus]
TPGGGHLHWTLWLPLNPSQSLRTSKRGSSSSSGTRTTGKQRQATWWFPEVPGVRFKELNILPKYNQSYYVKITHNIFSKTHKANEERVA